jgi:hypothetical protein
MLSKRSARNSKFGNFHVVNKLRHGVLFSGNEVINSFVAVASFLCIVFLGSENSVRTAAFGSSTGIGKRHSNGSERYLDDFFNLWMFLDDFTFHVSLSLSQCRVLNESDYDIFTWSNR